MIDAVTVQTVIAQALKAKSDTTPRTIQSKEGRIGPSDLGFCRQKAALMGRGISQSDAKPTWAADVGSAVHLWAGDALRSVFPTWIVDDTKVHAVYPCGATVSGTPDIIVPEWNAVLDIKTVDGFEKIKRFGVTNNHKMQRHTYALGAVQGGLLDGDRPVYLGNVYLDRSGQEPTPYVPDLAEFDPAFTDEVDQWITDVIYAIEHQEDASRDIAAPVCEKICEFYTVCRGDLPMSEAEFITDPDISQALVLYDEGRTMVSTGSKMKDQAKTMLDGISGSDGTFTVRWTKKAGVDVPGYYREPSETIDVRRSRR